jgi:predicted nucleic acid-binding protein
MSKRRRETQTASSQPAEPEAEGFWQQQVLRLGRKVLFVDTGVILDAISRESSESRDFLERQLVGDQLVTSTYVIAETVRRIVKSKGSEFVGPGGERRETLALYFLNTWLSEYRVKVICPPEIIFDSAKREFERYSYLGCDLVDVLSYTIVIGMRQKRILAKDQHFWRLGLQCVPSGISPGD